MLTNLKIATARLHARAESAMPTLDELTSLDRYVRCLSDLHGFYAAWEPAVWATPGVSAVVPDGDARRKTPLLARDLRALGQPVDCLVRDGEAPTALRMSCGEALGALYVLEGATLGGRVIMRHIAEPLGLPVDAGLSFFHGYGERTGPMWSAFGCSLQRWADAGGSQEAAVAGATSCFTAFESWLYSRNYTAIVVEYP